MKKFLLNALIVFIAFNFLGPIVGIATTAIILFSIIYGKRAIIYTQIASQAYYMKNNKEKAAKLYQKAYDTGIMTADCKTSYSAFCLRENNFDKGRRLLNEVINSSRSTDTERENAKHNLAILVWREGNLDEAIAIMEEVHQKVPATNTYGSLGVLYLERAKRDNSFDDTLTFLREAYEYNGTDRTIADNLGELLSLMGEYDKAKDIFSKLLATEQPSPTPYYNYAHVLKALGDIEGAKENLEEALTCRFTSVLTLTKEQIQKELDELN